MDSKLKFEAQGCQRQGKKVICQAWITSLEEDVDVLYLRENSTFGNSRLIDSAGDEYIPEQIQAGSQVGKGDKLEIRLTKNVPLKVTATFTNISGGVRDVTLLEVRTKRGYGNEGWMVGKLRNLKITDAKVENNALPAGSSTTAKPAPTKKKK